MGMRMEKDYIKIWAFRDAPQQLRELSPHGGDEDWLAVIPPSFLDEDKYFNLQWMESGSSFGCCEVTKHPHPYLPGWEVRIGCHS